MTWTPDVVIYHHPCSDGFGAAWACHCRWPEAEYIPANYGSPPPDVTDRNVLIVDFSYKYDVLRQLGVIAASVVVLDHHKTAEADLADFTHFEPQSLDDFRAEVNAAKWPLFDEQIRIMAHFDMDKSGARLAWEFAFPQQAVPVLIMLIEDRDLWRFRLPNSKPFATLLRTIPQTFDAWDRLKYRMEDNHQDEVMGEARAMQTYHDAIVRILAEKPRMKIVAGYLVPTVNVPGLFASDVGHALLEANPEAAFVACYADAGDGNLTVSLRSQDHRQDVSAIAKAYGGGGHRNAAGFRIEASAAWSTD